LCCNIGSDDREVQIDPAAHFENDTFDFDKRNELAMPGERLAYM